MTSEQEHTNPQADRHSKPLGLILAFSVLSLLGQYFFKLGMESEWAKQLVFSLGSETGAFIHGNLWEGFKLAWHSIILFFQPMIFVGMIAYGLSAVCWLSILSKVDLSFAYPMISIGYVAILLMGWLGFGEHVSWLRWMGVFLISLGILAIYSEKAFVSRSGVVAAFLLALAMAVLIFTNGGASAVADFDKPVLLIVCTIPLGVIGQILLKAGMNLAINKERVQKIGSACGQIKEKLLASVGQALLNACTLCLSPRVFCGLCVYVLSTVLWLVLLTKVPISFLYPLLSFGYVLVLLIGWLGFGEKVSFVRWYGVLVICLGIVFIYSEALVNTHAFLFGATLVALAASILSAKHFVKLQPLA